MFLPLFFWKCHRRIVTLCFMDALIIWIIAAVVLVVVEVLSQQVWTACFAIGAVVAALSALCGASLEVQLVVMSLSAILSFLFLVPVMKRWQKKNEEEDHSRSARTGMDALLGRRAPVAAEIRPGEIGRVRIDGDNWQAIAPGVQEVLPHGTEVVVTGYDSIILSVTPLNPK